ncbi:MAG TPA: CotH kinase family protein [Flavobacteriales bacterium]|nr:CotH kinase family protein [Flavobacteriales bacterium]
MKKRIPAILILISSVAAKAQNLYDINTIQKIEINFTYSNWDYMMDTAKSGSEDYIMAEWVKINGVQFDSVGVKYKGNSSYDATNMKNPLHIELDWIKNQDYQGFSDVKLGNGFSDPSMIREVLSYKILGNYMHCPRSNFAQVYINGSLYGLYSNSEAVNKDFLSDHFYSNQHALIKCNPQSTMGSSTPKLTFLGTDSSLYFTSYELKSDYGWNDLVQLTDTLNNNFSKIESVLDIDRAIWMLAFNNVMVNLDSYTGAFAQNYYLYMDDNARFNSVVWDLNMCFGGFNMTGIGGPLSVTAMQNMSPTLHSTSTSRPLIKNILGNAMYKRMYIAHMRTIASEMISSGAYITDANTLMSIADTAVQSDPYKFFTYTQFQNSLTTSYTSGPMTAPGIQLLMNARDTYLQGTTEFLQVAPVVSGIGYTPVAPALNDTVWITASITTPTYAYVGYRGSVQNIFNKVQLVDDGMHNDGATGDNVYGAFFVVSSPLMQYYIYAENANAGMFSPARAEHEFYAITATVTTVNEGDVVINEIMPSNSLTAQDAGGDYDDWVELYNNTSTNISLENVYFSDDYSNPLKSLCKSGTVIGPNDYLIVWLDQDTTQPGIHANFKLSASGEQFMLSYASGVVLDSTTFGAMSADQSVQRCPNGTGPFATYTTATYASENCFVGIHEPARESTISIYPNPANNFVNIVAQTEFEEVTILNAFGQNVINLKTSPLRSIAVNTNELPNGIYFVKTGMDTTLRKLIISR